MARMANIRVNINVVLYPLNNIAVNNVVVYHDIVDDCQHNIVPC